VRLSPAAVETPKPAPASIPDHGAAKWLTEAALLAGGVILTIIGPSALLEPALVGLAVLGIIVIRAVPQPTRSAIAIMASTTLVVAVPFKRLDNATLLIVTCAAALMIFGIAGATRRPPRGTFWLLLLIGLIAAATVLTSDVPSLFRLLPFAASSVPILWLVGGSDSETRRRSARFVVIIAVAESVFSVAEPFLSTERLWAPAQLDALGNPVPLMNPLLSAFERSQGTLGHPLALSFLLLIALAFVVRTVTTRRWMVRPALILVLLIGIAMSGSRNSLLLALILVVFFGARRLTLARILVGSVLIVTLIALGIELGMISAEIQSEFLDSGSYTHRAGAFDAFGRLLVSQQPLTVIFGNGAASTDWLFSAGLLQNDNLDAVDNQLVLTMAQGGLVSLAVLVGLLIAAVARSSAVVRPALLAAVASMFVFDLFAWPSATVLVFGILAAALTPSPHPSVQVPEV
jgi:hypothetical protein